MINRLVRITTLALAFTYLVGCASFHNQEVAAIDTLPDVSGFRNKPKVYVDLRFFRGEPGKSNTTEVPQALDTVRPAVEGILKDKNIFSEYTFDQLKQNEMDYKLSLHFYNHGNTGGAAVSGFLTGFTLGVIPGAATDNYTLKSELVADDNSLATVENKDSVTTWIGIWFIPMMGNTPESAIQKSIANQVKAALSEMIENRQLKYSLNDNLLYYSDIL